MCGPGATRVAVRFGPGRTNPRISAARGARTRGGVRRRRTARAGRGAPLRARGRTICVTVTLFYTVFVWGPASTVYTVRRRRGPRPSTLCPRSSAPYEPPGHRQRRAETKPPNPPPRRESGRSRYRLIKKDCRVSGWLTIYLVSSTVQGGSKVSYACMHHVRTPRTDCMYNVVSYIPYRSTRPSRSGRHADPRVRACIGMVRSPKANFPIRRRLDTTAVAGGPVRHCVTRFSSSRNRPEIERLGVAWRRLLRKLSSQSASQI